MYFSLYIVRYGLTSFLIWTPSRFICRNLRCYASMMSVYDDKSLYVCLNDHSTLSSFVYYSECLHLALGFILILQGIFAKKKA